MWRPLWPGLPCIAVLQFRFLPDPVYFVHLFRGSELFIIQQLSNPNGPSVPPECVSIGEKVLDKAFGIHFIVELVSFRACYSCGDSTTQLAVAQLSGDFWVGLPESMEQSLN